MIKSFVPIKSYHSLIISLLVVVTITAMFLLADEILLAGLNKKYILVSALLILAISFSTLIFRSYAFYKDLQLFLPDLWTSKLLSASTEYMIADDIGKVFLKSSDSIIDFCNNNIRRLFYTYLDYKFPMEITHENMTVRLYKLKDICDVGMIFSDCILITMTQNSKINFNLKEYWHLFIKSLMVPAYIEERGGDISINDSLRSFIGIDGTDNISDIAFQSYKNTNMVSLFYHREKISDFTRIKIYEDVQNKYFILLNNVQKAELNSLSNDHPIPALTIDSKANIKTANDAFYKMLGLEALQDLRC